MAATMPASARSSSSGPTDTPSSSASAASTSTLSPPPAVSIPHHAPYPAAQGLNLVVAEASQLTPQPSSSASHLAQADAPAGFTLAAGPSLSVHRTRRPPSSAHRDGQSHKAQGAATSIRPRRAQSRHSPFPPIMVANSINVALAIVPSAPPPPASAPPLTLSYRAGIDPKRIYIEESQYLRCDEQRRGWKRTERCAAATAVTAATPPNTSQTGNHSSSDSISITSSDSLTQQTPEDLTSESATPDTTFPSSPLSSLKSNFSAPLDPRQDVSIPDSTTPTPAAQSRSPTLPAWSQPRAWSRLASKDSGAMSFMMPGSSNPLVGPAASSATSEAEGPITASTSGASLAAPTSAVNGRHSSVQQQNSKAYLRQPRLSLEAMLANAHTRFSAPLTVPRGLINKGNFCFANAILQVLVFCAPFYNLFTSVGEEINADFANSTPLMEAVVHFLREFHLAERSRSGSDSAWGASSNEQAPNPQLSEPLAPEYVYEAMKLNKRFDLMRRGHQEDAEEFLGFFLDTLHEELLSAIQRSNTRLAASQKSDRSSAVKVSANAATSSDAPAAAGDFDVEEERVVQRPASPSEEGWMEVGQKGRTAFTRTTSNTESPITRTFGGKLRSVLRTPGAKDSVTLEPYQSLQLDIQPSHVHTIEDALLNLTVPETIPGVYSPARDGVVEATKQVFIERTPPILVLHLKRFLYDEVGGVQKNVKEVGYGETLDVGGEMVSPARRAEGPTRYRLFGAVYHHGKYASGGHYTVDVLRQDGSGWIHFDDTVFGAVASENVGRKAGQQLRGNRGHDGLAYLLFYKRQDLEGIIATEPENGVVGQPAILAQTQTRANSHSSSKTSVAAKVASTAINGHARMASAASNGARSRTAIATSDSTRAKKNDKVQQQMENEAVKPVKRTVPGAPPAKVAAGSKAGK